jgi:hypothetical protein
VCRGDYYLVLVCANNSSLFVVKFIGVLLVVTAVPTYRFLDNVLFASIFIV